MEKEHVPNDKNFVIPPDNNEVFTSSDPNFWDHVRQKDITKNSGIEPNDFHSSIVKELLDNAADFHERNHIDRVIIVHSTRNKDSFQISVRNSNPNNIAVFTNLIETFNFKRAYSSKSNQHCVTRGVQGDAIKKMSTMGYALDNKWNEPLIIQHNKRVERIYLHVNRKQGEITPKFEETSTIEETDTEIVITMPPIKDDYDYKVLKRLCEEHALFNTHISYKFHFNEYGNNSTIELNACHPIAKEWDNPNSVYCYSETDFGDFFNDIHDKKMLVYDALSKSRFRELRQAGSRCDYMRNVTLEKLTPEITAKIYHDLNKSMLPMSKLSVPYDTECCKRKQALINRYQQIKPASLNIDIEKAVYKIAERIHEDDCIRFPLILEVLAIPIINGSKEWEIIGGINYSTSVNNIRYFRGQYTNTYEWTYAKTGKVLQAGDIMQIIRKSEAGEDVGDETNIPLGKQRQQCVIIVHLVAPRIEYQSYGKSSLTLDPFQSVIAKTIEVVSCIPLKSRYNPSVVRPPSVIECLRQFLKKRWEDVRRNPRILDPNSEDYDAMTQSTVWYNLRKQYLLPIEERYDVTIIKENTREDVTAKISFICENDLEGHPKREELGIFASPRATMYVDGSWHNVDIDEIPSLAKRGTDVVFIEKRGVVEIVKYIGDIYGFAFVNTQGHFAEYPKDLIREIIENRGNVLILTDFDCAGIHIAEKVISDVIGEERVELIRDESVVFEVGPPYEITDATLAPPENLPANEGEANYSKTVDRSQKSPYTEYSGRIVRLGIDIQTLEYFVSKIKMTNINDVPREDLNLEVEKMKERVGEEYPKHSDPKKQQPGKNVITPIIT